MLREIDSQLFSPLSKEYCVYFYALTVISFVLFIMSVANLGYCLFKSKTKVLEGILALCGPAILYFNNRLLYSMCVH